MRDSSGLHYLLTDHLGSVVGVLDDSGDLESDERYLPFGGSRDATGISQTDFAFTGQRNLSSVGLMDYNARWYLPAVGRFISADTIVPVIGNPQSLNRYSYVLNSPMRFIDPSGHKMCNGPYGECEGDPLPSPPYVSPPGPSCNLDVNCFSAYLTYKTFVISLGYEPSSEATFHMTINSEYWAYIDYETVPPGENLRLLGKEAIARTYYDKCGSEGLCTSDELYKFLLNYEPWLSRIRDETTGRHVINEYSQYRAEYRVDQLIKNFHAPLYGTADELLTDVSDILGPMAIDKRWTTGAEGDRPWQWFTVQRKPHLDQLGWTSDKVAILYIDTGNGNYFLLFTKDQDEKFNPDDWKLK